MPMPASTNVRVTGIPIPPSSATPASMNNILFLTAEQPLTSANNAKPYKVYTDSTSVGMDYGTTSDTYYVAERMFQQKPNFTLGKGQLTIAPLLSATSATYGAFASQQITPEIVTSFQSISNGAFGVSSVTGGTVYQVEGLDFTNVTTEADIVNVVQNASGLPPLYQYLDVRLGSVPLPPVIFTSKSPGLLSIVTLTSPTDTSLTDLTGALYLGVSSGTSLVGTDSTGETLGDAVTRLMSLQTPPNFSAIITNLIVDDTEVLEFASFVQAGYQGQPLEWGYCFTSIEDCTPLTGVCSKVVSLGYSKTRMNLDFLNKPAQVSSAYNATLRSVNINTSNSFASGIPNLSKGLVGILPNVVDLNELESTILPAGVDMYLNVTNSFGIARPSSANGGQFNAVYFGDSILLQIQNDLINLLSTNTVTASLEGDLLLDTTVRGTMLTVRNCGMITPGVWSSAIPPGVPNQEKFLEQIAQYGFYIYVQSYTTRTPTEVLNGSTPPILVACNLTGGINVVVVNVYQQQN